MKLYHMYEKVGNRWMPVNTYIPKKRKVGKFALRRVTNRKAKNTVLLDV